MSRATPRPIEDFEAVFRAIGAVNDPVILVGGHAVNLWALSYKDRLSDVLPRYEPLMSGDLDLFTTVDALRKLHEKLGGKMYVSPPREITTGLLVLGVEPNTLEVDILRTVNGIPNPTVKDVVSLHVCGSKVDVPFPQLLLQAKLANSLQIQQDGRQDVKHTKVAALVTGAFMRESIATADAGNERYVLGLVQESVKIATSDHARQFAQRYGHECLSDIPLDAIALSPLPRLLNFTEHQLPRILASYRGTSFSEEKERLASDIQTLRFGLAGPEHPLPVPESLASMTQDHVDIFPRCSPDSLGLREQKEALYAAGFPLEASRAVVAQYYDAEKFAHLRGAPNLVFLVAPSTTGENLLPALIAQNLQRDFGGLTVANWATPTATSRAAASGVLENLREPPSFSVDRDALRKLPPSPTIVVVDDVVTTGASVRGMQEALAREGLAASHVTSLAQSSLQLVRASDIDRITDKLMATRSINEGDRAALRADVSLALAGRLQRLATYIETSIRKTDATRNTEISAHFRTEAQRLRELGQTHAGAILGIDQRVRDLESAQSAQRPSPGLDAGVSREGGSVRPGGLDPQSRDGTPALPAAAVNLPPIIMRGLGSDSPVLLAAAVRSYLDSERASLDLSPDAPLPEGGDDLPPPTQEDFAGAIVRAEFLAYDLAGQTPAARPLAQAMGRYVAEPNEHEAAASLNATIATHFGALDSSKRWDRFAVARDLFESYRADWTRTGDDSFVLKVTSVAEKTCSTISGRADTLSKAASAYVWRNSTAAALDATMTEIQRGELAPAQQRDAKLDEHQAADNEHTREESSTLRESLARLDALRVEYADNPDKHILAEARGISDALKGPDLTGIPLAVAVQDYVKGTISRDDLEILAGKNTQAIERSPSKGLSQDNDNDLSR